MKNKNHRPRATRFAHALTLPLVLPFALPLALFAKPVLAQQGMQLPIAKDHGPLRLSISQELGYDSNPYRLSDEEIAPGQTDSSNHSDWTATTRLRVEYDKVLEGQRITLSAAPSLVRYQRFDRLDHIRQEFGAGWMLKPAERTGLNFTYKYLRAPSDVAEQQQPGLNMVTANVASANLLLGSGARWQGLFGLTGADYKNSDSLLDSGDRQGWSAETGVRHLSRKGNTVDMRYRYSRYRNPERVASLISDNAYRQHEIESNLDWQITRTSTVQGKVGVLSRKHDNFVQRNFDGWTTSMAYVWSPNEISSLRAEIYRQLGEVSDASASYAKTVGTKLSYEWAPRERLLFTPRLEWRQRDYEGFSVTPRASDQTWTTALAARYEMTNSLFLTGTLGYQTRHSDEAAYEYDSGFGSVILTWRM